MLRNCFLCCLEYLKLLHTECHFYPLHAFQHGEAGAAVADFQPVDIVVSHVLKQILSTVLPLICAFMYFLINFACYNDIIYRRWFSDVNFRINLLSNILSVIRGFLELNCIYVMQLSLGNELFQKPHLLWVKLSTNT